MTEEQLSAREREVIDLLWQGKSNKQIRWALGISERTVEFHLSNIYNKLGVASRTEAVARLAQQYLRESESKGEGVDWGNPQLKPGARGAIMTTILYRMRRRPMRTFVRIVILCLAILLVVVLLVALMAIVRQAGTHPPVSLISGVVVLSLKG